VIRAATDKRTVLVTDAGRGSAIAMIRSLGRRGHRVIAADSEPGSLGFRSRYTDRICLYPSPTKDPRGFVTALLDAVSAEQVDLLIPVTDDTILPLSAGRELFNGSCRLALPAADALEITTNKMKTLELAARLGVPTPRTAVATSVEEACDAAAQFEWPIVIKPLASRLFRNQQCIEHLSVGYAQDRAGLESSVREFVGRTPVLMQEYIRGTGFGVEMLTWRGRSLAAFQHRRLREVPISGGASSLRESVPLEREPFDFAARMLRALDWTGLAMVEFKSGPRGLRLMEINGRPWGSLPLAVRSGVDFPALLAEMYLNGPPGELDETANSYRSGVRARNLELDLAWIGAVMAGVRRYPFLPAPSRREALAALIGLADPHCKFDIQSFDDPWPGLAEIPKVAFKLVSKLVRAGGRKIRN